MLALAADTSLLARAFLESASRQSARAIELVAKGVWVSHVVLHEFVWVAVRAYDHDHVDVAGLIERLLLHRTVMLEQALVVQAALDRFTEKPQVGFNDCLVLEIARAKGVLPLVTFDRDLSKLEGAELA